MVKRQSWGKSYRLVASTERRLGIVLMAIRRLDNNITIKPKRVRIGTITTNNLERFEDAVKREIDNYKKLKKLKII